MRKTFKKVLSALLAAALIISAPQIPAFTGSVAEAATAITLNAATTLEDGASYIILYNTPSGSNSDVSLFYTNTGELVALSSNGSAASNIAFNSTYFNASRTSITITDNEASSILWKAEALSGGKFALSNNGKYLTEGSSTNTVTTNKSNASCAWTYGSKTGEGYSYKPLIGNSGKIIRYSASAAELKMYDTAAASTNGRNGYAYLYKVTSSEEFQPTASPAPTKAPAEIDGKTPLCQILTASDYQKWNSNYTNDNWDFLQPQLRGIVSGAYNAGFTNPDFFIFGGDFSCLGSVKANCDEGQRQVLTILREKYPQLTDDKMLLLQGNHDAATTNNHVATNAYEYDNYIVYMLNEDEFPTTQGSSAAKTLVETAATNLETALKKYADAKETRPIIIASHTGLHYDIDRTDGNNQYAYKVYDVIKKYADNIDVIFMFGHNHTNGDERVGGSITLYKKGESIDICHEDSISKKSGTTSEINFVYMNYGYIGYIGDINNNKLPGTTPTNILAVSRLAIYDNAITVDRYTKDGLQAKFSAILARDHADSSAPVATKAPTAVPTATPTPTPKPTTAPTVPPMPATTPNKNNKAYSYVKDNKLVNGQMYMIAFNYGTHTSGDVATSVNNMFNNKGNIVALADTNPTDSSQANGNPSSPTFSGGDSLTSTADNILWIVGINNGKYTFRNAKTGKYLCPSGDVAGYQDLPYEWTLNTFEFDDDIKANASGWEPCGKHTITQLTAADGKVVRVAYSKCYFSMYSSDTGRNTNVYFYKYDGEKAPDPTATPKPTNTPKPTTAPTEVPTAADPTATPDTPGTPDATKAPEATQAPTGTQPTATQAPTAPTTSNDSTSADEIKKGQDVTVSDIVYTVDSVSDKTGTITIKKIGKKKVKVVIPKTVVKAGKTLKVVGIGKKAFKNCKKIKKITIKSTTIKKIAKKSMKKLGKKVVIKVPKAKKKAYKKLLKKAGFKGKVK